MINKNGPARNTFERKFQNITNEAMQPSTSGERISYGVITEVDVNTSQVKVILLKDDGTAGEKVGNGFLPLLTSLDEIYLKFGILRPGLRVRLFWKGRIYPPQTGIVEVIGDESYNFLKKQPAKPEIEIGCYRLFSGGLG